MRWFFLFGLTRQYTLRELAIISGSLAASSVAVFILLIIIFKSCAPKELPEIAIHDRAMNGDYE